MLFLIIGYREATFYGDKEKYARRMGSVTVALGIFIISMPLSLMVFGEHAKQMYEFLAIAFVILIAIIANYWRFRY